MYLRRTTTPITTCQRTKITNFPQPKQTQHRRRSYHDNECEEKNDWCVKKEKEEEEVSKVILGIFIKVLGAEELLLLQEESPKVVTVVGYTYA